jgi:class 3 adenylate cyclase
MTTEGAAAVTSADVERRIVSVLFADLVGFTPLSERLDAEDVATIQDAYFGVVRETVGRYGGQLEKFIGDAAMAVFGVPRARDDDAERAVRAGLALVAAVEQLGARLGLEAGDLRLRVGVNTGEVVHAVDGPDAGRVTGDAVNTAARLQAAADPGSVLVGEETGLAVADAIELESVGELALKGKAAPVRAMRAGALRPERSREVAMGRLRAPTIGRDREIERLTDRLATISHRSSERWLLVAPPGVGKTRLVEELALRVRDGAGTDQDEGALPLVWRMRLRPEPGNPFAPLVTLAADALRDAGFEREDPKLRDLIQGRLVAAGQPTARAAVVAEEMAILVAGAREPGPASDRSARFAAWLEGLDSLADGRPQVWLVEDAHWADPDLVAFLDAATEALSPGGKLIVVTARPTVVEVAPTWAHEEPARRRVELETLPSPDAGRLVEALVDDALPAELVAAIVERSDGNCLFIEELLRTWVGTGALVETETGWRLTIPPADVPLPATVQAIYAAQLDDLPPQARLAARRGAVAGRRFPLGALETLGVPSPSDAVDDLRRRAIVAGPLDDPLVGEAFSYRHALLRDAGYASLARSERADLHVRLARWLEGAAGDRALGMAAAIGDHLASAVDAAPALSREVVPGATRAQLALEAATWLERAGDDAMGSGAVATAAGLYRRAVALGDGASPIELSRRATKLGRALAPTGGVAEAEAAFVVAADAARAARAAGESGWRERFAEAVEALAGLLFERIRFVDAWRLGEDALVEMGDADDLPAARVRLARSRGRTGETNDASGWIADAERAIGTAEALGESAVAYEFRRDLMRARSEGGTATGDDWVAFRADAEAHGDVATIVSARLMEAAYRSEVDPAGAAAILAPARELAVARGLVERLGWLDHATADAALGAGDWDTALEAGMRAVELGERHGYDRISVRSWSALLPVASLRGETAVLGHCRHWFEERRGRLPDSPYGRVLHAGAAAWMRAGGIAAVGDDTNVDGVLVDADHLRASFDLWLAVSGFEFVAATDAIVDAWFRAGRLDWLAELIEGALAATLPPDSPGPSGAADFTLTRARFEAATGAVDAVLAAEHVRRALGELRAVGTPFWIARGLRLLEELGSATDEELTERARIERDLRVVRPALDPATAS